MKALSYFVLLFWGSFFLLKAQASPIVHTLNVSGTINVGTADYIESGIKNAAQSDALFVVIKLDTEGGTLQSTRQIVKAILNSPIPVIVYVFPKGGHATSAGTFITLAADVAVMAPGTHIGAAHPVLAEGKMDEVMNQKATNDTAAFAETLAKAKGRNVEWARLSVEKSESLIARTALDKGVIDLIADDLESLKTKLRGFAFKVPRENLKAIPDVDFEFVEQPMSTRQRLLAFFAHPQMALWILSLGGLCLWIELSNPGLIFPGVLGGLCIVISLISLQLLPIHYGALALIFLGMGLMVAEVFITSYGVLGIGGAAAFIFGSLFLVQTDVPGFQITILDIVPMVALLGTGVAALAVLVYRSRQSQFKSGLDSLVGQFAEVKDPISNQDKGKVFVVGELWNAVSASSDTLPKGTIVVVKEVRDMLLVVEPQSGSAKE